MDKENFVTVILIVFILFFCYKIYLESETFNLKCIISNVNNKEYCIRERKNSKDAVDLLAKISDNCDKLLNYLKENDSDNKAVMRLIKNYKNVKISETLPTSKLVAYSENKGEKIAFCLNKDKNNNNELIDQQTLMFVALHELAHVMTVSVGHTTEFWTNFKFLIKKSKKIGIYSPVDYEKKNVEYCGMTIKDNPYYNDY